MSADLSLTPEEVQNMIKEIDFADNKRINYSEFLSATINVKDFLDDDRLNAIFNQFDIDNSVRLWDTLLADPNRFDFTNFVCVALVSFVRDDIIDGEDWFIFTAMENESIAVVAEELSWWTYLDFELFKMVFDLPESKPWRTMVESQKTFLEPKHGKCHKMFHFGRGPALSGEGQTLQTQECTFFFCMNFLIQLLCAS